MSDAPPTSSTPALAGDAFGRRRKRQLDAPKTSPTPAPAGITPELLTAGQAAELLAIGQRTLWRWSRSGICPAPVKIGRGLRAAVRYRRAELLDWIANGCPRAERGQR